MAYFYSLIAVMPPTMTTTKHAQLKWLTTNAEQVRQAFASQYQRPVKDVQDGTITFQYIVFAVNRK